MIQTIPITRRGALRCAAGGAAAAATSSGWLGALAADAAAHPSRTKSVVVLWMTGGPATIDL